LLVYGITFHGHGFYVFPLGIWVAAWWAPLLAIAVALPVGLRRRDPVGALILALAGCSVIVAVGGEINRGPFLPLALVLFTVAASCKRTVAVAALTASLALLVVQGLILSFDGRGSGPATGIALILIIAWMIGISAQQRRSYTARVREQVATTAVTEERLRIARELHDVVAHSMTVVAVQAGFGEYVFDQEPAQAREALGAIQHVTGEALADMQRLLGVLRQDGTGQPRRPPGRRPRKPPGSCSSRPPRPGRPGPAGVHHGRRGRPRGCDQDRGTPGGPGRDRPVGVPDRQELLMNVVKHSGASSCRVGVGYERAGLSVEITDHGAGPAAGRDRSLAAREPNGTGHGILGMRERVSLCGGEFTAGPLPERGFRVAARFPLPALLPLPASGSQMVIVSTVLRIVVADDRRWSGPVLRHVNATPA
jgi:signal transduction histidine kinase